MTSAVRSTFTFGALILALAMIARTASAGTGERLPDSVIVDASDFIDHFVKNNTLSEAHPPEIPWLFNNLGMNLKSKEDLLTTARITEDGAYNLFVRAAGAEGATFKVSIDGNIAEAKFGGEPLGWKYGGTFFIRKGPAEIRLIDIAPSPLFDCLILTKSQQLLDADILKAQFPEEVELIKDYKIPRADGVKFGDLNGDEKMDFVVFTPDFSVYAYDFRGTELWHWDAPAAGAMQRQSFECPGSVWDFDQDGKAEVIHWRQIDDKEWLCMSDGATGAIKYKVEWPTDPLPHVYNNFRTAIARLHTGYADGLIVYTDCGGTETINAYGPQLNLLWSRTEKRLKDYFGHNVYPVDINGDGVDEIFLSHLCLDAKGKEVWNNFEKYPDNRDHVNSARFLDLDGDGALEMITGQSDIGAVVYHADTGQEVWKGFANHAQKIEVGNFLVNAPAPQIVAGSRIFGERSKGEPYLQSMLRWFGPTGRALDTWPPNPINGNPNFVKGDWYGLGKTQLFWYRFHINEDGKGTLFFSEEVFHMFDFLGNGAEQVITLNGPAGILRIYGAKDVRSHGAKRDSEYLRTTVANHSHY